MILIPLDRIQDSPFQTRQHYDQASIESLADSIERGGLDQVPKARLVYRSDGAWFNPVVTAEERLRRLYRAAEPEAVRDALDEGVAGDRVELDVQLAFGHRRLRAFRLIAERRGGDLVAAADGVAGGVPVGYMPVELVPLTDEQMFAKAVGENAQRRDLSAVEEAEAMQAAIERFGWTHETIGERFGLSRSAVSNKLRLLKLPAEIRELNLKGEMSEAKCRALVALYDSVEAHAEIWGEFEGRMIQDKLSYPHRLVPPSEVLERAVEADSSTDVRTLVERLTGYIEAEAERREAERKRREEPGMFDGEEAKTLQSLYAGIERHFTVPASSEWEVNVACQPGYNTVPSKAARVRDAEGEVVGTFWISSMGWGSRGGERSVGAGLYEILTEAEFEDLDMEPEPDGHGTGRAFEFDGIGCRLGDRAAFDFVPDDEAEYSVEIYRPGENSADETDETDDFDDGGEALNRISEAKGMPPIGVITAAEAEEEYQRLYAVMVGADGWRHDRGDGNHKQPHEVEISLLEETVRKLRKALRDAGDLVERVVVSAEAKHLGAQTDSLSGRIKSELEIYEGHLAGRKLEAEDDAAAALPPEPTPKADPTASEPKSVAEILGLPEPVLDEPYLYDEKARWPEGHESSGNLLLKQDLYDLAKDYRLPVARRYGIDGDSLHGYKEALHRDAKRAVQMHANYRCAYALDDAQLRRFKDWCDTAVCAAGSSYNLFVGGGGRFGPTDGPLVGAAQEVLEDLTAVDEAGLFSPNHLDGYNRLCDAEHRRAAVFVYHLFFAEMARPLHSGDGASVSMETSAERSEGEPLAPEVLA